VECKTSQDYCLGRLQDISEGGVLIVTPETFRSQTGIVIRFHLPPYPPGIFIESQGVVVRVRPGEYMGIQFLLLTDEQRKAITKFVQQALEQGV